MASYIGNQIQSGEFKKLDSIESSFDGSTTTFNLSFNGTSVNVGDVTSLTVSLNGVVQEPGEAYTLANGGSQIVFSGAPASGSDCFITQIGSVGGTATPSDGSVTTSKLAADVVSDINDKLDSTTAASTYAPINNPSFTGYVQIPTLTTTQRDALTPQEGYLVYNTSVHYMQQYTDNGWQSIAAPPIITSMSYSGSVTAVLPAGGETITISGANFEVGANVKFGTTYATSVTRNSSTSLTVTVPALTAGDYDITVENASGLLATLSNGLSVNAAPVFSTSAGNIGSITNNQAMSTITIVATEDDSGTLSYQVTTGSLPTGLSLGSANGQITGTPTGYTNDTTVNFTVTATDDENQTTDRQFNIVVLVLFYEYEIDYSIRYDRASSPQMTRSFSDGNRQTWTWSAWVKPGERGGDQTMMFGKLDTYITIDNVGRFGGNFRADSTNYFVSTQALLRNPASWYHLMVVYDSTQSTASDRQRFYINGVRQTDMYDTGWAPQNYSAAVNSSGEHKIGAYNSGLHFDGHMAEIHFFDGAVKSPTDFGQFKQNIWVPKEYTGGGYGTNGFYLNFSDRSSNAAIAYDSSGNNNHFSPENNLHTTDVMKDSPTNNFAVLNHDYWNPIRSNRPNYREGLLSAENVADAMTEATISVPPSGKWYYEAYTVGDTMFGWGIPTKWGGDNPGGNSYGIAVHANGYVQCGGNIANTGSTLISGATLVQIAIDLDNNIFYVGANGTWRQSADFVNNTGGTAMPSSVQGVRLVPAFRITNASSSSSSWVNFGQDSTFAGNHSRNTYSDANGVGEFRYPVPTGFKAVCTANLSESGFGAIKSVKPSDHFDVITYTGTGTSGGDTLAVTGLDFQPDLVWIKNRSVAVNNYINDVIRGTGSGTHIHSNTTDTESSASAYADNGGLASIDSNGFTVYRGTDNTYQGTNLNGNNYVAWCWKAGGTAVSNTNGSINSTVSANQTAGFSIVQYGGTGTAGETVGHGLSQAPDIIIGKRTSGTTSNWWLGGPVGGALDSTQVMYPNLANARETYPGDGIRNTVTSTTFEVGTDTNRNRSGDYHTAYCWHSVEGYSSFGTYQGNGSSDGTFINTGFKVGFLIIRPYDLADAWQITDSTRSEYNPTNNNLFTSLSNVEQTGATSRYVDFVSNGFTLRGTNLGVNGSGYNYIYMAFAEDPFKYSNAR